MGARVDGRAADVHPDRAGRRRQLDEPAREGAREPHRPAAAPRLAAARRSPPRARGRARRPVSASRSAFRSPPTAFSSRTISLPSSPFARAAPRTARASAAPPRAARTGCGSRIASAIARASFRSRAPRSARASSTGAPTRPASSSSESAAIASIASRRSRGRSSWTSCAGSPSSSRYARAASAGIPASRRVLDRGDVLAALRQLLPVLAEQQAVMDVLRRLEAERARELLLKLAVRTMVGAADDVRDLEVGVVDDAREVVCRTAVGPKQGQPAEAERALVVLDPDARRRLAVPLHPPALTHRPLVPADPEPFEVGDDPLAPLPAPRARRPCRRSAAGTSRRGGDSRRPRAHRRDEASP